MEGGEETGFFGPSAVCWRHAGIAYCAAQETATSEVFLSVLLNWTQNALCHEIY